MIRLTLEQAEDIVLALKTASRADSYAYVIQLESGEIEISIGPVDEAGVEKT